MTKAIVEAVSISKRYGDIQALKDVDLTIKPGEILALLGNNGAGKTTLISIIAGVLAADAGRVTINGIDSAVAPSALRRIIGFAPQELGIYLPLTVRRNLKFSAEINCSESRRDLRAARVEQISDALGLSSLLDRPAEKLSGGEKRRLHTAMALLHNPQVVLLDEPTVGADVESRNSILSFIRGLAAAGAGVLYCTHYLHEVEALEADVVILSHGSVIARGEVGELIKLAGESIIEVEFDEITPVLAGIGEQVSETRIRIAAPSPGSALADLLRAHHSSVSTLRSVEVLRPSLESVYVKLTGRRFESNSETEAEPHGEG